VVTVGLSFLGFCLVVVACGGGGDLGRGGGRVLLGFWLWFVLFEAAAI
jgi:hypothetical protein